MLLREIWLKLGPNFQFNIIVTTCLRLQCFSYAWGKKLLAEILVYCGFQGIFLFGDNLYLFFPEIFVDI